MSFHSTRVIIILSIALLLASAEERLNLQLCLRRKTYSVQLQASSDNDASCQCQASGARDSDTREDYTHTAGVGSHKFHTYARPWNEARKICKEEGGHLAVINSRNEEAVLLDIFSKNARYIENGANKEQAFIGTHDFFKEGDWVTVFDEPLASTGYAHWSTSWWGTQPDNKDNNQNCGALVHSGGMDDVHCHESFAFFCELPMSCDKVALGLQ